MKKLVKLAAVVAVVSALARVVVQYGKKESA